MQFKPTVDLAEFARRWRGPQVDGEHGTGITLTAPWWPVVHGSDALTIGRRRGIAAGDQGVDQGGLLSVIGRQREAEQRLCQSGTIMSGERARGGYGFDECLLAGPPLCHRLHGWVSLLSLDPQRGLMAPPQCLCLHRRRGR